MNLAVLLFLSAAVDEVVEPLLIGNHNTALSSGILASWYEDIKALQRYNTLFHYNKSLKAHYFCPYKIDPSVDLFKGSISPCKNLQVLSSQNNTEYAVFKKVLFSLDGEVITAYV